MESEGFEVNDHAEMKMTPPLNGNGNGQPVQKKAEEYSAVLFCTLENCRDMFEVAVQSRTLTKKRVMLIIKGEK